MMPMKILLSRAVSMVRKCSSLFTYVRLVIEDCLETGKLETPVVLERGYFFSTFVETAVYEGVELLVHGV